MPSELLITRSTTLPLETVCQRLTEVATSHKFGVLATHNLREKMESKGVPFSRECGGMRMVLEFSSTERLTYCSTQ